MASGSNCGLSWNPPVDVTYKDRGFYTGNGTHIKKVWSGEQAGHLLSVRVGENGFFVWQQHDGTYPVMNTTLVARSFHVDDTGGVSVVDTCEFKHYPGSTTVDSYGYETDVVYHNGHSNICLGGPNKDLVLVTISNYDNLSSSWLTFALFNVNSSGFITLIDYFDLLDNSAERQNARGDAFNEGICWWSSADSTFKVLCTAGIASYADNVRVWTIDPQQSKPIQSRTYTSWRLPGGATGHPSLPYATGCIPGSTPSSTWITLDNDDQVVKIGSIENSLDARQASNAGDGNMSPSEYFSVPASEKYRDITWPQSGVKTPFANKTTSTVTGPLSFGGSTYNSGILPQEDGTSIALAWIDETGPGTVTGSWTDPPNKHMTAVCLTPSDNGISAQAYVTGVHWRSYYLDGNATLATGYGNVGASAPARWTVVKSLDGELHASLSVGGNAQFAQEDIFLFASTNLTKMSNGIPDLTWWDMNDNTKSGLLALTDNDKNISSVFLNGHILTVYSGYYFGSDTSAVDCPVYAQTIRVSGPNLNGELDTKLKYFD